MIITCMFFFWTTCVKSSCMRGFQRLLTQLTCLVTSCFLLQLSYVKRLLEPLENEFQHKRRQICNYTYILFCFPVVKCVTYAYFSFFFSWEDPDTREGIFQQRGLVVDCCAILEQVHISSLIGQVGLNNWCFRIALYFCSKQATDLLWASAAFCLLVLSWELNMSLVCGTT